MVLVAAGGLYAWKAARFNASQAAQCQAMTAINRQRGDDVPVSSGGETVVVLGDSWSQGVLLDNPREQTWSTAVGRLNGWTTYVNAIGGTGFAHDGFCGDQKYATRIPSVLAHNPDMVIVQGGLNDTADTNDGIAAGDSALLHRLAGVRDVVVIGPPAAPARPEAARVDAALRATTQQAGRRYVSTLEWALPYGPDQLHMTAEGHQQFAQMVTAALR